MPSSSARSLKWQSFNDGAWIFAPTRRHVNGDAHFRGTGRIPYASRLTCRHVENMPERYVPKTEARESRGIVTLVGNRVAITAPDDYGAARWFKDPTKETGYVHSFLRPYRAVVSGVIPDPGRIVYPLIDGAPLDGLRCPGALSVYKNPGRGFTFVLFPAMERRPLDESEVDHLTAHVDFEDGTILANELHAKVRNRGRAGPTENLQLERVRDDARPFGFVKHDAHHLAFEYWCRDVRYPDPAGSVESTLIWSRPNLSRKAHLRDAIEHSIPTTVACSAPTQDGLVPLAAPFLLRVGLLTEKGRQAKGGTDAALSQPHGMALGVKGLRLHRYRDIRGIDPSWPDGVSLFVEVGLLKTNPPSDYNLPDVRGTAFERMAIEH